MPDMFDNDFASCMDKSDEEIDSDLKTYSSMTILQGQIRLNPGSKRSLKAAIQWVKDLIRTDNDPTTTPIPNNLNTTELMRRSKTHVNFIKKSSSLSTTAMPDDFYQVLSGKTGPQCSLTS